MNTQDFNALNGSQLVLAFNVLVEKAIAAGLEGYRPVTRFADKISAVKRCEALASSLRARAGGFKKHVTEDDPPVSFKELVDILPPGRARMLSNPKVAEEIRQRTIEAQNEAREGVERVEDMIEETVEEPVKKQKKAKEPKAPKEKKVKAAKSPKERTGRVAKYPLDAKIHLLVDKNPHREGTKNHQRWFLYRDGMTLKEALDAGLTRTTIYCRVEDGKISITP